MTTGNLHSFHQRNAKEVLTRWAEPLEYETAPGLFLRLADIHLLPSAALLASEIMITINQCDPQPCLEALLASRHCSEADAQRLRKWTIVRRGAYVDLAGERMRRFDYDLKHRRFCPGCLAEAPYHRFWFDLTFFHVCPLHGVPFVDAVEGEIVRLHHANFQVTPEGRAMAHPMPRVPLGDSLEAYALGRWGVVPETPNAFLDLYPLSEIVEAAELLGRLKVGGHRPKIPLLDSPGFATADMQRVGYEILSGGEAGIKDVLRAVAVQCDPSVWGVRGLLGWAHYNFAFKRALALHVKRLMNQVAAEMGRRARIWTAGLNMDGECLMITEVAARIGRGFREVRNVARMLDLFQPHTGKKGNPRLIHRDDIPEIVEIFDDCLQRTEAAVYLGVSQRIFDDLVLAGHIEKLGTRWGEEMQDRFAKSELDAFLDRLPVQEGPLSTTGEWLLSESIPRVGDVLEVIGYDAGKFVTEVMDGELTLYARTACFPGRFGSSRPGRLGASPLVGGLQNFRIQIDAQPLGHPFTVRATSLVRTREQPLSHDAMTMRQVCAHLDVDPKTVKHLADRGLIATVPSKDRAKHYSLDRESVLSFGDKYIASKLYAATLECHVSGVPARLREEGISSLWEEFYPDEIIDAQALYERAVLRQSLGLTEDPDTHDYARRAWKGAADRLAREKSFFAVWQIRDPAVGAMISTADRIFHMEVTYHLDRSPLFKDVDAYRIDVELEYRASEFRHRKDHFQKCLLERDLHPAIETWFDPKGETCGARIRALVTIEPGIHGTVQSVVAHYVEADTKLIARMLNMIKGAFEDGERPYDKRLFGSWPTQFCWYVPTSAYYDADELFDRYGPFAKKDVA